MNRDEFAKQFIERGKATGASKADITIKLQSALMDFDKSQGAGLGEEPNLLKEIGTAIVAPIVKSGKTIATGLELAGQTGKYALGNKNAFNEDIIPDEYKLSSEQVSSVRENPALEAAKQSAGLASYAIPGGAGLVPRLASGATAGASYAFSQVEEDASLDEYIKDVAIGVAGGVAGAGIVYGGQKLASKLGQKFMEKLGQKYQTILHSKPEIPPEIADKAAKRIVSRASGANQGNVAGLEETVYASGLPFSKKGFAFEKLKPQQTFKTMIEDGVWGTPAAISKKANMVTGRDGVVSNIVREGLDQAGSAIDVPSGILSPDDVTGVFTTLSPKDVGSLQNRLARAAPGSTITGKDSNSLFDFTRKLEKEAWDVLSKGGQEGKLTEFAQLKLVLAGRLEDAMDAAVNKSGATSNLAKDPAIIAYLEKNVSPQLARRVAQSGGDLRVLRSVQKDYYRIMRIAELSSQENSSLGRSFFKWIDQIPAIGATLSALSRQGEAAIGTGLPVMINKLQRGTSSVGMAATGAVQSTTGGLGNIMNRMSPIVGAATAERGLGGMPPQL